MDTIITKHQGSRWQFLFWGAMLLYFPFMLYQQATHGMRWISLPMLPLCIGMLCHLSAKRVSQDQLQRGLRVTAGVLIACSLAMSVWFLVVLRQDRLALRERRTSLQPVGNLER